MSGTRVSRRSMLGSVGAVTLSPTLLQASVSDLPGARLAFAAALQTGPVREAACGSRFASITGGSIQGRRLAGTVQGGRIECRVPAAGGPAEVTTHLLVARADGSMVEVHDHGVLPDGADLAAQAAIATRPELQGGSQEGVPALLVGRLDARELGRGMLTLQVFEVF